MEQAERKKMFRAWMNAVLLGLSTREIAPNMLAQQQFEFRLEGELENAYLYHDEMVQAVALSCVPMEIINMEGQQVKQLKALLKWFKEDFFTWCDKPKCTKCGVNTYMAGRGSG